MNTRPRIFLIIVSLVLLSLALVACERERPLSTPLPTNAAEPRGTVAPSPTPQPPATQVTLPGVTGAQATPGLVEGATPTAPAPQQVVVGTPDQGNTTGGSALVYTVAEGDTLAAIAARYGVTQEALIALNALVDPDQLAIGQQLKIPGAGSSSTGTTPSGNTAVYVVQSGDTLAAIGRKFGATVDELAKLNNLTNPDRLAVGQKLLVPAAGGAVAPGPDTSSTGQKRTHIVAEGETLLTIANIYGVTVEAIRTANNILDVNLIFPGQVLQIP